MRLLTAALLGLLMACGEDEPSQLEEACARARECASSCRPRCEQRCRELAPCRLADVSGCLRRDFSAAPYVTCNDACRMECAEECADDVALLCG